MEDTEGDTEKDTEEDTEGVTAEAMVAEEATFLLRCIRHIPEEATVAAEVTRDMDTLDLRLILLSTMVRKIIFSKRYVSKFFLSI